MRSLFGKRNRKRKRKRKRKEKGKEKEREDMRFPAKKKKIPPKPGRFPAKKKHQGNEVSRVPSPHSDRHTGEESQSRNPRNHSVRRETLESLSCRIGLGAIEGEREKKTLEITQ